MLTFLDRGETIIAHSRTHRADRMTRAFRVELRRIERDGMTEYVVCEAADDSTHVRWSGRYYDSIEDAASEWEARSRRHERMYHERLIGTRLDLCLDWTSITA